MVEHQLVTDALNLYTVLWIPVFAQHEPSGSRWAVEGPRRR